VDLVDRMAQVARPDPEGQVDLEGPITPCGPGRLVVLEDIARRSTAWTFQPRGEADDPGPAYRWLSRA